MKKNYEIRKLPPNSTETDFKKSKQKSNYRKEKVKFLKDLLSDIFEMLRPVIFDSVIVIPLSVVFSQIQIPNKVGGALIIGIVIVVCIFLFHHFIKHIKSKRKKSKQKSNYRKEDLLSELFEILWSVFPGIAAAIILTAVFFQITVKIAVILIIGIVIVVRIFPFYHFIKNIKSKRKK